MAESQKQTRLDIHNESFSSKLMRKSKEDPWVPVGAALVVGVLGRGLHAMYKGDTKTSYRMMRYRILWQGSVVLALVFGMYAGGGGSAVPGSTRAAVDKRFYLDAAEKYAVEVGPKGPGDTLPYPSAGQGSADAGSSER